MDGGCTDAGGPPAPVQGVLPAGMLGVRLRRGLQPHAQGAWGPKLPSSSKTRWKKARPRSSR